jgi:hypothetical protein
MEAGGMRVRTVLSTAALLVLALLATLATVVPSAAHASPPPPCQPAPCSCSTGPFTWIQVTSGGHQQVGKIFTDPVWADTELWQEYDHNTEWGGVWCPKIHQSQAYMIDGSNDVELYCATLSANNPLPTQAWIDDESTGLSYNAPEYGVPGCNHWYNGLSGPDRTDYHDYNAVAGYTGGNPCCITSGAVFMKSGH